ncbi:MAG: hypothetical protein JNL74_17745, partial [Fibrobacteres bacterium]|nr:hypothetical protein [Fibrobacterota bacterium]
IIETPRETLRQYETNPLYKPLGIRAVGKQNLSTGELDPKTLKFKEFITYSPIFDSTYLDSLINAASNDWVGVENVDAWLHEMREG